MKIIFIPLLLLALVVIPNVNAGGEVTNPQSNTLRMEVDTVIRQLNNSPIAWDVNYETPAQMWETDNKIGLEIWVQNKNFHRLTLIGNSRDRIKYPIYLCAINEIIQYRGQEEKSRFCENYPYSYRLKDRKVGQKLTFRIPPLINGSNAWSIWVGGDGSPLSAAGGGGGHIPDCLFVTGWMFLYQ